MARRPAEPEFGRVTRKFEALEASRIAFEHLVCGKQTFGPEGHLA